MAKDVAEEKQYEHITAYQRAIQLALGAELKLHPERADLVEQDSLIEIDEELEEHGFPVQQVSPSKFKKKMEKVFDDAPDSAKKRGDQVQKAREIVAKSDAKPVKK